MGLFVVLWRHRKHLHTRDLVKLPPNYRFWVQPSLGLLYRQYEKDYWWFELAIILEKMLMTGSMVLIADGTSLQLLIATLLMLSFLLLVLRTAPYERDSEDISSFTTSLVLTLTF